MNVTDLEFLLTMFDEEKRFVEDGYYRLRKKSETEYELAYLVADACGTTTVHPQITISVEGEEIKPTLLIDFGSTPTKNLKADEENKVELENALTKLAEKFKQASQTLNINK